MILVMDNTAYHHKRVIRLLNGLFKKKLIEMAKKYQVDYLDLPFNGQRMEAFDKDSKVQYHCVENCGDYYCITVGGGDNDKWDEIRKLSRASRPFVPSVDELRIALVSWMKENRPDLLECQVEKYLQERGHEVIYTAPYTPKAQLIAKFW
eukprot:14102973-Ditylum_brightwellii.AAC.1